MVNFYISLIKQGKLTINKVPERWRKLSEKHWIIRGDVNA